DSCVAVYGASNRGYCAQDISCGTQEYAKSRGYAGSLASTAIANCVAVYGESNRGYCAQDVSGVNGYLFAKARGYAGDDVDNAVEQCVSVFGASNRGYCAQSVDVSPGMHY